MTILIFLRQLTSGAMLLVVSVRFTRIGLKRLWSVQHTQLPASTHSPLAIHVGASLYLPLFEHHIKLVPHHAG